MELAGDVKPDTQPTFGLFLIALDLPSSTCFASLEPESVNEGDGGCTYAQFMGFQTCGAGVRREAALLSSSDAALDEAMLCGTDTFLSVGSKIRGARPRNCL
jgi:hypothetical protein